MSDPNPNDIWRQIQQAGGMNAYINQQLQANGYLVERRDVDDMSKAELKRYKNELKEEAKEKRRIKQKAWQAYKQKHIVHIGENVYWTDDHAPDKWDLPDAEERAAENELPPLDKAPDLADAIGITIGELRSLAYHRDAATGIHYHRFTIPKRSGKERAIWAPKPRLKAAQHWILHHIVERLPVHGAAHGFLPGRSTVTNAAAHTGSQVILKMDIADFFPTVSVSRVKGIFRKAGYREPIAILLSHLCTEAPREVVTHGDKTYYIAMGPRCLPQGAPTSPGLTNSLCLRMDRRLEGLAKKYGWRYTRYADDLTFSLPLDHKADPHTGAMIGSVTRIVADEGFQIRTDKTRVHRQGGPQQVTGLSVNTPGPPKVPRELKRRVRAQLHNLSQGKPILEGENLAQLEGYIAYIYMVEPELGAKLFAKFAPFRLQAAD